MKVAEKIAELLQSSQEAANANIKTLITPVANAKGYGAKGNGVTDDSVAIQKVLNDHKTIFFGAGTFVIGTTVAIPNDKTIICLSPETVFTGLNGNEDLFDISGKRRINWYGGKFKHCNNVFKSIGDSALAYCRFVDMAFYGDAADDIGTGFYLDSAVGNEWRGCHFGHGDGASDSIGIGVHFTGIGAGQTNVNRFDNCTFMLFKTNGVKFGDTNVVKVANKFTGCWFEDSPGSAISLGGSIRNLTINGASYFENCGGVDVPVIDISNATINNKNIIISDTYFAVMADGQTEIIKTTGNNNIVVRDTHAALRTGAIFLRAMSTANAAPDIITLERVYLNSIDAGIYKDKLFSTNGQRVDYVVHADSGNVTGDDYNDVYTAGEYVNEQAGKGWVVTTPDGANKYRIRVDNTGAVVTDLL